MVRAPALQAGCRGFESLSAHQNFLDSILGDYLLASEIVCGELGAVSLTTMAAESEPATVGA